MIRKEYARGKLEPVPRILDNLQDQINTSLLDLSLRDIIRGKFISRSLSAGNNIIYHELQRQPKGWIVVDRDSAATVYRSSWDLETLVLTASASVDAKIYVF